MLGGEKITTKILIIYYSAYGHVFKLAKAVRNGAKSVQEVETRLRKVPEIKEAEEKMKEDEKYIKGQEKQKDIKEASHDDLRWADGICWGTPTRFGNMVSQLKQFLDTTGGLWVEGVLEDKPAGVFTSTSTIHGGQESTILASMIPLLHHGMIIVGSPYGQNPQLRTVESIGGSPYGPGTLADVDNSRQPVEDELDTAENLGKRVARVASLLKPMWED